MGTWGRNGFGRHASIVSISLPIFRKIESGDGAIEFPHVVRALAVLSYAETLAAVSRRLNRR